MSTFRQLTIRGGIRGAPRRKLGTLALGLWLSAAALSGQTDSTPYFFTTLAGRASIGTEDGPGASARFSTPFDVAVDRRGNLFVADTGNHTIRKIAPDGAVSTFAGLAGVAGAVDGSGSAARFGGPESVAIDAAGNLFVSELRNGAIRKITAAGVVTTVAQLPKVDVPFVFSDPATNPGPPTIYGASHDLAVADDGTIYATDAFHWSILKIMPDGTVTTLAGSTSSIGGQADGTGSAARFGQIHSLALDAAGNLLVADTGNHGLREVTPAGEVTTIPPPADFSNGFFNPKSVAVDTVDNVYVVDGWGSVWQVTPAGELQCAMTMTNWDNPGLAGDADGMTVDPAGNLYLADTANSAILKRSPSGGLTRVAGAAPGYGNADGTGSAARFLFPQGVGADDAGEVFVADTANHIIRMITRDGVVTTLAGLAGAAGADDGVGSAARFNTPEAVAVDKSGSNIYVADTGNHAVRRVTRSGAVTTLAGLAGVQDAQDGVGSNARFVSPASLAMDAAGNVLVADYGSNSPFPGWRTIRRVTPAGSVTTIAWLYNAPGISARIISPLTIAIDAVGNVVAADLCGSVVWKIAPDGTAAILAGTPRRYGGDSVDGGPGVAQFTAPAAVAVDTAGNVLVADYHAIRRIAPDGTVTTVAGMSKLFGSADGIGSAVRFNAPAGLVTDGAGRVYVADTDNNTIRVGMVAGPPVIATQPQSQTVASGGTAQFTVAVSGAPDPGLQWYRNGAIIDGATDRVLVLVGVLATDAGDYTVMATNDLGTVTSDKATLTVTSSGSGSAAAGGGGGGASAWFVLVLLLLAGGRWVDGGVPAEWCALRRRRIRPPRPSPWPKP